MKNIFTTILFLGLIMQGYQLKASDNVFELSTGVTCSTTSTDSTCGQQNGTATVNASGGIAPYSYAWSNGDTQSTVSNLSQGNYTVTVTDATGCESECMITIVSSDAPTCSIEFKDTWCDSPNGWAVVTALGGTAPFTYSWSNGASSSQIAALTAGIYSVTLTDAMGCTTVCFANINMIDLPVSIECADADNVVSANSPGVQPLTYLWDNGSTSQEIPVIDNMTYTVTVTDANGCSGVDTYTHATFNGTISCNNVLNVSTAPFGTLILPDMLVEGPLAACDTEIQFSLTDEQGNLITDYTDSYTLGCSDLGEISFNLIDNISGLDCSGVLLVEDKTPPVIVCTQGATVVLGSNQQAEIWAIDLDAGSYDFCQTSDLRFTFSNVNPDNDPNYDATINSSFMELGCDDFFGVAEVTIYAWDDSDNFNACIVSLNIDDTSSPCTLAGNHVQVVNGLCNAGTLDRYNILLNGNDVENTGCFYPLDAANLVSGTNVMSITNVPNNNAFLNGVTTLDLVLFQRGLLQGFNSGIEAVLSDFDGDLAVSTQDMTQMRMAILGLLTSIDAPDHKMFPADYVFPSDFNPYNQLIDFTTFEFDESEVGNDLQVEIYKSGDLNNSAFFNTPIISQNREDTKLSFDNVDMQVGQSYFIDFEVQAEELFGATMFELLAEGIEFKSIDYHGADIIENMEDKSLKLSFIDMAGADSFTFTLEVDATQNISAENALSMSDEFLNEVGFTDLSIGNISLTANDVTAVQEVIDYGINIFPNPTNDFVNLSFDASFSGLEKKVELISLDGRILVSSITQDDQLQIDTRTFNSQGLNIVKAQVGNKIMLSKLVVE